MERWATVDTQRNAASQGPASSNEDLNLRSARGVQTQGASIPQPISHASNKTNLEQPKLGATITRLYRHRVRTVSHLVRILINFLQGSSRHRSVRRRTSPDLVQRRKENLLLFASLKRFHLITNSIVRNSGVQLGRRLLVLPPVPYRRELDTAGV